MLKKDRNSFLELISREGLDPKLFRGYEETSTEFTIELLGTPLRFVVRNSSASYREYDCSYVGFGPTEGQTEWYPRDGWLDDFEPIKKRFSFWLQDHVRTFIEDQMIPDLWAITEQEHEVFGFPEIDSTQTDSFATNEREALRIGIAAFRLRIIEAFEPSDDQLDQIERRLEYLSSAIDRLNKLDWKSLLLSTIIGVATTLSLDTERGRLLFEIGKQVFSNALHLLK